MIYTATTVSTIHWELIAGGFGLFLFGIKFMGDGLKSLAGDKLREYIDRYTSKPFMAVLIGAFITILIQSSSATTAITIGLVRAGLMRLEQAAGIVMGANIGTTVTSFLVSMNIEQYALYFIFVGALILSFGKRKKNKYLGEVLLGFGILFFGLSVMGDALKTLKDLPEFNQFAVTMGNQPILALLAGTLMTAIIQSSSSVIAIVQKMYEADALSFNAVLPFVFGSNIGTTITGILAAIGGSLAARRTAGVHTFFNVVGTLIGMLCLIPFTNFVLYLTKTFDLAPMMQIAIAHITFNIVATILFFPFLKQMCSLIRKIIPGTEPERREVSFEHLDNVLAHALPSTALEICKVSVVSMGEMVANNVNEAQKYYYKKKKTEEDKEIIYQDEAMINKMDTELTKNIMKLNREELTEKDMNTQNLHLQVIKNLERIGDLAINLVEFFEMVHEDRCEFSKAANEELNSMFELFAHMFNKAMEIYQDQDYSKFQTLMEDEGQMDLLEYTYRKNHFERMSKDICQSNVAGAVYCDVLGTLERMADHCCNISRTAIEASGIPAPKHSNI